MTKEKMTQIRTVFKDMIKNKKINNAKYLTKLFSEYVDCKKKIQKIENKILTENDMELLLSLEDKEFKIDMVINNYKWVKND